MAAAVCNAFRFLRAKAKNVKSGTKLSPLLWQMFTAMVDKPPNLVGLIAKESSRVDAAEPKKEKDQEAEAKPAEPKSPEQACKAAKSQEDQSPGSVLAIYGVNREHAKTVQKRPLRK